MCFSGTGLPSHRTTDHILSILKNGEQCQKVSPDHVSLSLFDQFPAS
jgi:hypothetical protein